MGLLHTGTSYPDDLSEDGVLYHYPRTQQPTRDDAEVSATKAASVLGVPVFTIAPGERGAKRVHLSWVEGWNDKETPDLLQAAHLVPVSRRGSFDPRNGLVLCYTHHRALGVGLFAIDPESHWSGVGNDRALDSQSVSLWSILPEPQKPLHRRENEAGLCLQSNAIGHWRRT